MPGGCSGHRALWVASLSWSKSCPGRPTCRVMEERQRRKTETMTKAASLAKTIGTEAAVGSLGPLVLMVILVQRYSRKKALRVLRRVALRIDDAVSRWRGSSTRYAAPSPGTRCWYGSWSSWQATTDVVSPHRGGRFTSGGSPTLGEAEVSVAL